MGTNQGLEPRYDVVILGGGAAGLSAAKALARFRRSVLVVDAREPRNAPAGGVHNYLGREGVPPAELLAAGRAELAAYGGQVITAQAVGARRTSGTPDASRGGFVVELADGREVHARRLLVTTGLVDGLPQLPGLAERWGRDVLHCPYCHGWEVRDQAIGVLATGPLAAHQALLWRQLSDDVTLLLHTTGGLTDSQAEQLAVRGVAVVPGEVTGLEVFNDQLRGVQLRGGQTVRCQALVVTSSVTARADVLAGLGLEPGEARFGEHVLGSRIEADATGATAVAGVWAAGNATDPPAQVMGSANAGLTAGAAINADLIAKDTERAVAAARRAAA